MEINLSYKDVERIVADKFKINLVLNPYPQWYDNINDEFTHLDDEIIDEIVLKFKITSDNL